MQLYETEDDYTKVQTNQMVHWFNENIGTDYEINDSASGGKDEFYIIFCDLLQSEVEKIRIFELKFRESESLNG